LLYGALQIALLFPALSNCRRNYLARLWSRQLVGLLGIRIDDRVTSKLVADGLLVSNHISLIDIFVINAVLPSSFISKSEVSSWPLIGWMSRNIGTIFIERGSRRAAHRTQENMVTALSTGRRLAIFPEGTTTSGTQVLPFHSALFQSAVDAAVPVHALSLRYYGHEGRPSSATAYIDELSVLDCLLNTLRCRGLGVSLSLAASFPAPHQDRRHLTHHCHQAIASDIRHYANAGREIETKT
jgi:1-acyl-sn-glycerol-3-phosphate acyltransferase